MKKFFLLPIFLILACNTGTHQKTDTAAIDSTLNAASDTPVTTNTNNGQPGYQMPEENQHGPRVVVQKPYSQVSGIYICSNYGSGATGPYAFATISNASWSNQSVAGETLRFWWSAFEPADGQFVYTAIDGQLNEAVATGKKLSISMMAGIGCPKWIFTEGAQSITLVGHRYGS